MSTLSITPGSGALVRTDLGSTSGAHMQVTKLAESVTGSDNLIPATVANGLLVQVSAVAGAVSVVNSTPGNLKVDASGVTVPVANAAGGSLVVNAPVGTPVALRVSNGSAFIDTIPVSIAGTVPVSGTVGVSGTVTVTQSGVWSIASVTSITNPVTVTGTVYLGAAAVVSGTVTANQGAPNSLANAWPNTLTDGTNTVGLTTVGGAHGLNVVPLSAPVGGGISQQDKTSFVEGTTFANVIAGVFNDSPAGFPAANQASVARITPYRAIHVNLRNQSGVELGTATSGVRTDQTEQTYTRVSNAVAFTASTSLSFWVPASGKRFCAVAVIVTVTASGRLQIYDGGTPSSATMLYQGTPPIGVFVIQFPKPWLSAAANNVMTFTTGSGATGDITTFGYEV